VKNSNLILIVALISALWATAAVADLVTFDFEPLGTPYGNTAGMAPGDVMFSEFGATLYVDNFYSGGSPFFNSARIDPAFTGPGIIFGANQILQINNVGVIFNFSSAGDVTFEYMDLGGSVNLLVNGFGAVLEAGDMADLIGPVAPGVTMNATVVPFGGGHKGTVTLTGPVQRLRIGGQEFWIDDVKCDNDYEEPGDPCDFEVSHQTQPVGRSWGAATNSPGDLMFIEDGIPVYIDEIDWGTGTGFNFCEIQAPGIPGFGFDRVMNINNVSNVYRTAALGIVVQSVSFEYVDYGGLENLQVNGTMLHIGEMTTFPLAIAPGVAFNVSTFPIPGGVRGEVTLTGDVRLLLVAGQEFMIDNICVVEDVTGGECDLVSDNESQAPGDSWGGPFGNSPGDIIFNEDGIDVGLARFDSGAGFLFNTATTDGPWGPLGTGNVMHINNIGVTYDLSPFSPVASVSFDYVRGGGIENLGVDGMRYVGPLDGIPAGFFPGFHVSVAEIAGPGFNYGTVTVTGDVSQLLVGGQQFYMDDLCVILDHASDVPLAANGEAQLQANYPNPFNPSTTLRFSLGQAGHVRLAIVDVAGRRLATLVDGLREAGDHQMVWNGRDDSGRRAASGLYFVRLEVGEQIAIRKIALLK